MRISVHHFQSTAAAYDAAMSSDDVETGDVLVIPSERVVGLADTWPVAVTVEGGELHHVRDGMTLEAYGFTAERVVAAEVIATSLGFPLNLSGENHE